MQGALTRIGDTVDRLTGRRWVPSSSLATSELIERMKKLLDAEAKSVPGKGVVVPHNIKLKMQWDKFSTDADDALERLQTEMLTAAADHINDSLYYTYAPLKLEVKPDYFTEGVKLFVSFEKFSDEAREAELNVTLPVINIDKPSSENAMVEPVGVQTFIARYELNGSRKDRQLKIAPGARLSVGRTAGNDLMIEDVSVSKIHGSLVLNADHRLSVADTGSTNGTFINGERMAYGKASLLREGDKVKFGTVEIVFEHIPVDSEFEIPVDIDEKQRGNTVEVGGFEFTSLTGAMPEKTFEIDPETHIQPKIAPDEKTEGKPVE